jgi:hypothetical protein
LISWYGHFDRNCQIREPNQGVLYPNPDPVADQTMEASMREIAMVFICFASFVIVGSWAMTILLAVKSGRGIQSLLTRQRKKQWLLTVDTIAQYGDDHTDPAG